MGLGFTAALKPPHDAVPWELDGDRCHHHFTFSTRPACLHGQLQMRSPGRAHLIAKSGPGQGRLASELLTCLHSILGTFSRHREGIRILDGPT